MSPHDVNPTPRTVDADVSAIFPKLPVRVAPEEASKPGFGFPDQTDRGIRTGAFRIGPVAWANINFVVGSCLIALFCMTFVSENVQHFRRSHLRDDVVYAKADRDVAKPDIFTLTPPTLVSNRQFDRSPLDILNNGESHSDGTSPGSTMSPFLGGQNSSFSPDAGRVADNGSVNNATATRSNNVAQNTASQSTNSKATASTGTSKAMSVRSTAARSIRTSRKHTVSVRSRNSVNLPNLRHGSVKTSSQRSPEKVKMQNPGSVGNDHAPHPGLEMQTAAARNQMPMHSMRQGSVTPEIHGATNLMRMESGSLAGPAIGGAGNFGAIGHHGGHLRR